MGGHPGAIMSFSDGILLWGNRFLRNISLKCKKQRILDFGSKDSVAGPPKFYCTQIDQNVGSRSMFWTLVGSPPTRPSGSGQRNRQLRDGIRLKTADFGLWGGLGLGTGSGDWVSGLGLGTGSGDWVWGLWHHI